jgi:hypothetical protein
MPELETRLRALAEEAVWPATPDLAAAVAATPRPGRGRAALGRRPAARRALAVLLATLLLVPAAAVAFPGARDDVLEWLGLREVEIRRVPTPPAGTRPELEADLGTQVTLAQARRDAGFAAVIPAALGKPDRVRVTGQRISLIYAPRDDLPSLREIDAGLILTQSRGGIRGVYLQKLLLGGTRVDRVSVRGRLGAFISGGEHAYLYETPDGDVREDRPLLAGPTLVWTAGGRVFRLEAAVPRRKALQIARSVRP